MTWIDSLLARDLLSDPVLRFAIRRLVAARRRSLHPHDAAAQRQLVEELRRSPIASHTREANAQHYEVPAEFFQLVLGRRLKYSSAFWPAGCPDLDAAEEAMLALTAERADLHDGQEILEIGCGWGSLTLFLAERLPHARILALSNSASQRHYIVAAAERRGLGNVEVVTADVNAFATGRRFDRVVSVEMFEHLRNYQLLFERIAHWLRPEGRLFVHVFCHRHSAYPFEARGRADWLARYFFTGGLMPSANLLLTFDDHLRVEESWLVDGTHYQKTAEAWLANMDLRREAVLPVLERTYGRAERTRWWVYWRVFFMACAELFGHRGGQEWLVAHYRFRAA